MLFSPQTECFSQSWLFEEAHFQTFFHYSIFIIPRSSNKLRCSDLILLVETIVNFFFLSLLCLVPVLLSILGFSPYLKDYHFLNQLGSRTCLFCCHVLIPPLNDDIFWKCFCSSLKGSYLKKSKQNTALMENVPKPCDVSEVSYPVSSLELTRPS